MLRICVWNVTSELKWQALGMLSSSTLFVGGLQSYLSRKETKNMDQNVFSGIVVNCRLNQTFGFVKHDSFPNSCLTAMQPMNHCNIQNPNPPTGISQTPC